MADDIPSAVLDEIALRAIFARCLRELNANGLARKVELGYDINVRTLAALRMARQLAGLPEPEDVPQTFIRDHS